MRANDSVISANGLQENERAERGRFDEDGKTRGDRRAFCVHATPGPRGLPGPGRVCLLVCPPFVPGSTTGAVRPDDPPTVRRYDALPDEGTVGAIGIVFVTAPTIVAIPRPDAEAERADLHASPSGV